MKGTKEMSNLTGDFSKLIYYESDSLGLTNQISAALSVCGIGFTKGIFFPRYLESGSELSSSKAWRHERSQE
jgi:hypothetical protein